MDDGPSIVMVGARTGDDVVLTVIGDLDFITQPAFADGLLGVLRSPWPLRVVIDLDGVGFIDSAGISALLHGRQRAHDDGVALEIVRESVIVRQVLEMMGLLQFLRIDTVARSS